MFNRDILKFFDRWYRKRRRKPLVIRGARQVGKTVAITLFGQKNFKDVIVLNLEKDEFSSMFQRLMPISELVQLIQLRTGKKIIPGSTLLFIDEIQNSQIAMTQMRYFYEELPQLHVMAAGSLLEVKIKKEGFSFPVARVEYCYMYPVTFYEFLEAIGDTETLEYIKNLDYKSRVPEEIHSVLLKKYYEYVIVGGMPEAVAEYIESRSFIDLNPIYESILTGFKDDVYKYASKAKVPYLQHVIEHSPKFAGKTIKYENFGESGFRSREMKDAFDVIEKAMIVKRVYSSNSIRAPIIENQKKSPKIIFLDSGLVNYSLGVREDLFITSDLNIVFQGQIAEQIVGQTLQTLSHARLYDFSYWFRDSKNSLAEIDFLTQWKSRIIPIEVKSGKTGHLKSMRLFMNQSRTPAALRFHSGNLLIQDIERPDGSTYKFISLPFYLVHRLQEILDQFI
ncbi:MAG: ATP-binding protein [Candidatus Aminicenantes bacterium]|nr:MAG: ATP-binding protein [Candidatus Aminicenantes bacterium]